MNPDIFRQYDIRGVVGRDLSADVARQIGHAFSTVLKGQGGKSVAIGRDCRLSSPLLSGGLVEGLMAGGAEVIDLGMVPTPVLYFNAFDLNTDGAIQLTGSHNPPDFNGFKMMLGRDPFYGTQIELLRELIAENAMETVSGKYVERDDGVDRYVQWIVERAQMGTRPVKVVIDAGNGAAGPSALMLFERLGVEVIPMYCEPDGRFPNHHPDPTLPENLEGLRQRVLETGADCGIGYDGDGDRLGVVDGSGETLWGDRLMIIFAREILRDVPGATILGEVKCSQTLFDDIAAQGGKPLMWKVGHSLIKAKMKEVGALLGGEMSGHIFFKHRFLGFDDALYATTRLIEILSRDDRPLSDLLVGIPETFATPEIRLDMGSDTLKFKVAQAIADRYKNGNIAGIREVVTLDGVRLVFEDGWGLVRASNTQPVLVMRAEANSAVRCQEISESLSEAVKQIVEQVEG
jgi:phosphomannomutase/phosphoglucomutase